VSFAAFGDVIWLLRNRHLVFGRQTLRRTSGPAGRWANGPTGRRTNGL